MSPEGMQSGLVDRLVRATGRATEAKAEGRVAASIDAIVRSLRLTLACVLAARDPREVGRDAFAASATAGGELVVRHRGRVLPVSGSYLAFLFEEAGMELAPGETILLDAALSKDLAEEALARIGLAEAQVGQEKALLRAAYLCADALEQGPISSLDRESEEPPLAAA